MTEVYDRPRIIGIPEEVHFPLMEYVREVQASEGYYDVERVMKGLQGKLLDKNGEKIDPVNYIKSTLNVMKVGCMIAIKEGKLIFIGYSQWADKIDEYDPLTMFDIAVQRAFKFANRRPKVIPFKIARRLGKFLLRARAYYKDATLVDWARDFLIAPKLFLAEGGPQYDETIMPRVPETFFNEFVTGEIKATDCGCDCQCK